jgi:pyruvate dehydrogenase E2 component (dihydrolipoamide acetyltransferase)
MATEVIVPVPDQTTEEVRIVSWKKQPGENVEKGEVLLEIETDKAVMDVEAIASGVLLDRLAEEDAMVPVGQLVGHIGDAGEKVSASSSAAKAPQSEANKKQEVKASPVARKLAAKLNIDLSLVSGSGGRITREDVEAFAAKSGSDAAASDSDGDAGSESASPGPPADVTEVIVPVPDQTTEEVRIVGWAKSVGQTVEKGELLLEIETDKAVMEVEAIASGTVLKQLAAEDDMVPVGTLVGYIGPEGSDVGSLSGSSSTPVATQAATQTQATAAAVAVAPPLVQEGGRVFSSPNARRIARELGVDYRQIGGTGPGGRVLGKDVEAFAASGGATAGPAVTPAVGQPQPGSEVALTKMRRAIGVNLQKSFRDTPHFNVAMHVDMTKAMAVRAQLNAGKAKEQKVSVNDLVVRAAALGLKQYPAVNSRLTEDKIVYLPEINIGVAIALETGLVVPVLTQADTLGWADLAAGTKNLANSARQGKLLNAGKGSFTISNLGMYGVDNFTAIINPPESAILAIGATKDEVVAIDGGIGIKPMMTLTLCSDHRVIDGAQAALFLQSIKQYLEESITA